MKTMKELREEIEAKHGKSMEEIAQTVLIDDLTIEEFCLLQVMINFNHSDVICQHTEILNQLLSYPDADEEEVMFG